MLLCLKSCLPPRHPANCRPRLVVEAICDGCGARPPQGLAPGSARRDHDILISYDSSIGYLILILCAREHLCGLRVTPTSQSTWHGARLCRALPRLWATARRKCQRRGRRCGPGAQRLERCGLTGTWVLRWLDP